jgi:hypothetical protein
MPLYNVHVYGICRVKVFNVEAESQQEATQLGYDEAVRVFNSLPIEESRGENLQPDECEAFFAGYSDDIEGFLVDEVGDEEYANSQDYDKQGRPICHDLPCPVI